MSEKEKDGKEEETKVEVLEELMGSMGRYQWIVCLSLFLIKFPLSWHLISQGIMVPKSTPIYCENTTQPIKDIMTSAELKSLLDEACSESCPNIIVSNKFYDNTIVHQYELYCNNRDMFTTTAQLVAMSGVFIGNIIFGWVADIFGRKMPLIFCILVQPFLGIGVAFSPNVYCFLVFKFLLTLFVSGTMISSFVLFSEIIGVKWRSTMGILFQIPFTLGHLSLALFGYLLRDWRWFQLTISLPAFILLYYYWVVPESPRWLLTVGKIDEGIREIEHIALKNNLPTEHIRERVLEYLEEKEKTSTSEVKKGTFVDLFRTVKMSAITIGMWINWFAVCCSYYGVAQYVGSIGSNVYFNFALSALTQIPGTLLLFYTLNYWGRKWTMVFANLLAASALMITEFTDHHWQILPASIAMCGLAMGFPSVYIYSGELFPTVIRNIGIGSSSSFGRIGGMIASVIADLKKYYDWLPPVCFAAFMAIAALSIFILPETKDYILPDTVEDVNKFGKKQGKKPTAV